MPNQNVQNLAEKIANLLQKESPSNDFLSLQNSIEKINQRLDNIEKNLNPKSQISNPKSIHPSLEKYNVIEAIVDEVMANSQKEKTCTFEPNDKPCDFCSMCSSRGF